MKNILLKNWYWILIAVIGILPCIIISPMIAFLISGVFGNDAISSVILANLFVSLIGSWPMIILSLKIADIYGKKRAYIAYFLSLFVIFLIFAVLSGSLFLVRPLT